MFTRYVSHSNIANTLQTLKEVFLQMRGSNHQHSQNPKMEWCELALAAIHCKTPGFDVQHRLR